MARQSAALDRARAVANRLSLTQRIVVGAGIATTLVAVFLLAGRSSTVELATLYTDLKPADAAQITEELAARNVTYELGDNGTTVLVPRDSVHQLRLDMAGQGLPVSNDGYALLDKQGITTSEFKQQVNYQRALEGELARTISSIDGVETAIVHLALPKDTVFVDAAAQPKASVLVRTRAGATLSDETVQGVRHLVASSVRDLTPENVSITDATGRQLGDTDPSSSAEKVRSGYEAQLAASLNEMIGRVVGADRVHVTVAAQLNLDQREETSERYQRPEGTQDGEDGLTSKENVAEETYNGATPGQTGLLGPDGAPVEDTTEGAVTYDKGTTGRDIALDRIISTTKFASGSVERLSIAVALDEGAVPAESVETVASLVAAAAGVVTDRGDTVVVSRLPFDTRGTTELDEAEAAAESAAASARMMAMIRTGLLALLALLGLFLGYRSVRRARQVVVESIPTTEIERVVEQQTVTVEVPVPVGGLDPLLTVDDSTSTARRAVEDFADEHPEQTAQLMRTWLNER